MATSVRHPICDYQVTYRRLIELLARILAACLTGERPAYGTRAQCSVFICDLSDSKKFAMRSDPESRMCQSEVGVMIVDLGGAGDSTRFLFLGRHEKLPSSSAVII